MTDRRPEESNYMVDILTRCSVDKEVGMKKATKIVSVNEHGEPLVVSLPLSQVLRNFGRL